MNLSKRQKEQIIDDFFEEYSDFYYKTVLTNKELKNIHYDEYELPSNNVNLKFILKSIDRFGIMFDVYDKNDNLLYENYMRFNQMDDNIFNIIFEIIEEFDWYMHLKKQGL